MEKFIKLFGTHNQYESFTHSEDFVRPNVSVCQDQPKVVHYNHLIETKVVAKYNVTSTSSPTALRTNYEQNIFKSMEIDGVMLDELVTEYTFNSVGVHTVKYELYDDTSLGLHAPTFSSANLIEVIIPDSVTNVSNNVFNGCTGLVKVTMGKGVINIDDSAFYYCTSLASIGPVGSGADLEIPSSVTRIGYSAFASCTGLTSVTIPNSVTSIGSGVFQNCSNLTGITVDSGNSVYDSRNNCNAIIKKNTNELIIGCKNTTIPNNVTTIGQYAFTGCSGLTSVTIPNSVTTIGQYAFTNCSGLTNINIPSGVTSISNYAFQYCSNLTSINIPSGVTSIGSGAFWGCSKLTSIDIPSGVTSIGSGVFQNCSNLTSIDIPSGVTSIGNSAFQFCSNLTSVTIPNSVTSIGGSAFYKCSKLTNITCNATTAPTIKNNTFQSVKTGGTLTVPSGSTGYNTWMGTGNYYLGKYGWTKVEQ